MARVPLYNGGDAPPVRPPAPAGAALSGSRAAGVDLSPVNLARSRGMEQVSMVAAEAERQGGAAVARALDDVGRAGQFIQMKMAEAKHLEQTSHARLAMEAKYGEFNTWRLSREGLANPGAWQEKWQAMAQEAADSLAGDAMSPYTAREISDITKTYAVRAGIRVGEQAVQTSLDRAVEEAKAVRKLQIESGDLDGAQKTVEEIGALVGFGQDSPVVEQWKRENVEESKEVEADKAVEYIQSLDPFVAEGFLNETTKEELGGERFASLRNWVDREKENVMAGEYDTLVDGILKKDVASQEALDSLLEETHLDEKEKIDLREILHKTSQPPVDRPEDYGNALAAVVGLPDRSEDTFDTKKLAFPQYAEVHRMLLDRLSPGGPREELLMMLRNKWHAPEAGQADDLGIALTAADAALAKNWESVPKPPGATKGWLYETFMPGTPERVAADEKEANSKLWRARMLFRHWVRKESEQAGKVPDIYGPDAQEAMVNIFHSVFGKDAVVPPISSGPRGELFPQGSFTPEQAAEAADQIRGSMNE